MIIVELLKKRRISIQSCGSKDFTMDKYDSKCRSGNPIDSFTMKV